MLGDHSLSPMVKDKHESGIVCNPAGQRTSYAYQERAEEQGQFERMQGGEFREGKLSVHHQEMKVMEKMR